MRWAGVVMMMTCRVWNQVEQQSQSLQCFVWMEGVPAAVAAVAAAAVVVAPVLEGVAVVVQAAVRRRQEKGGVWRDQVRGGWTASEESGGLVFQTGLVFCVLFAVWRWVSHGDAVECADGVECQGCRGQQRWKNQAEPVLLWRQES